MNTYVYFYKSDSTKEPIGRVIAYTINEAVQKIVVIKKLSEESIEKLLVIKKLD
jgi:hypothetical protein